MNEISVVGAHLGLVGLGWVSWWASEYLIHRFVGHGRLTQIPFTRHHRKHHALGNYFAPIIEKVQVSAVVSGILLMIFGLILGLEMAASYTVGFVISYLAYEWIHRRAHSHPPTNRYGRWIRRHHFYHHFMNPSSNHGVTTILGDLFFGTNETPEKIKVPEKLKMDWLTDPNSGEVWPQFTEDYELIYLGRSAPERRQANKTPMSTNKETLSLPCP